MQVTLVDFQTIPQEWHHYRDIDTEFGTKQFQCEMTRTSSVVLANLVTDNGAPSR